MIRTCATMMSRMGQSMTPRVGRLSGRKLLAWLQEAYGGLWYRALWPGTLDTTTKTLAAQSTNFTLPKTIHSIFSCTDPNLKLDIRIQSMANFGQQSLVPSVSANALNLTPLFTNGILTQPTSAERPKFGSTSTSDTFQVYIEGISGGTNDSGEIVSEMVTLTGTTLVTCANTYSTVTRISKQTTPSIGTILLKSNAATTIANGTTYATVSTWEVSPLYAKYQVSPTPTVAATLQLSVRKRFVPLIDMTATPFMDCSDYLEWKAVAIGLGEYGRVQEGGAWNAGAEEEFKRLLIRENVAADEGITPITTADN